MNRHNGLQWVQNLLHFIFYPANTCIIMKSLFTHPQHPNARLSRKLKSLSLNLNAMHEAFLEAAKKASDNNTAWAIYDLATFVQQSYNELVAEIQVIERKPYTKADMESCGGKWRGVRVLKENAADSSASDNSRSLVHHCASLENKIVKEYQLLLENEEKCGSMKSLLQSQLNGFLYGLARLQLLRACEKPVPRRRIYKQPYNL
jgi:hypothetical protein